LFSAGYDAFAVQGMESKGVAGKVLRDKELGRRISGRRYVFSAVVGEFEVEQDRSQVEYLQRMEVLRLGRRGDLAQDFGCGLRRPQNASSYRSLTTALLSHRE
jgi:hypothetical protein